MHHKQKMSLFLHFGLKKLRTVYSIRQASMLDAIVKKETEYIYACMVIEYTKVLHHVTFLWSFKADHSFSIHNFFAK